jgi:hypothetical protein
MEATFAAKKSPNIFWTLELLCSANIQLLVTKYRGVNTHSSKF